MARIYRRFERAAPRRKEFPGKVLAAGLLVVSLVAPLGVGTAQAGSSCDSSVTWKDITPGAVGSGGIDSIKVTSSSGRLNGTLFVRVDVSSKVEIDRLLIDADDDWSSGMWTAQSDLSASGWDYLVDSWSNLYAHRGNPRAWDWNRDGAADIEIERGDSTYRYCIDLGALKIGGSRIRITAENDSVSLPLRFLPGVSFPASGDGISAERIRRPGRMVFNYSGQPWAIRDCSSDASTGIDCANRVYGKFRHVVLGARLEERSRTGHDGTKRLITALRKSHPKTEVWGYISIVGSPKDASGIHPRLYSPRAFLRHAKLWKKMGVTGVFVDEFDICYPSYETCQRGPKGPVKITRSRQTKVVRGLHRMGLAAFVNGNSPQDAMGVYRGRKSWLRRGTARRPADMYLLENPTVSDGRYHTGIDFEATLSKFLNAIRYKQQKGVRIGVLDSMPTFIPDDAAAWPEYQLGWWRAAQANADGYAFFGRRGHDGNVAILERLRGDLGRVRAHFEANGLAAMSNGWKTRRFVADCTGARIGSVTVERIAKNGTAIGGYESLAEADPSC